MAGQAQPPRCGMCFSGHCKRHPLQDHGDRARLLKARLGDPKELLDRIYERTVAKQLEKFSGMERHGAGAGQKTYQDKQEKDRERAEKRGNKLSDKKRRAAQDLRLGGHLVGIMLQSDEEEDELGSDDRLSSKKRKKGRKKDKKRKRDKSSDDRDRKRRRSEKEEKGRRRKSSDEESAKSSASSEDSRSGSGSSAESGEESDAAASRERRGARDGERKRSPTPDGRRKDRKEKKRHKEKKRKERRSPHSDAWDEGGGSSRKSSEGLRATGGSERGDGGRASEKAKGPEVADETAAAATLS